MNRVKCYQPSIWGQPDFVCITFSTSLLILFICHIGTSSYNFENYINQSQKPQDSVKVYPAGLFGKINKNLYLKLTTVVNMTGN